MCEFQAADLLQPAGMTAFSSAMQRVAFGGTADLRAASARSKKIKFTVWARRQFSPLAARRSVPGLRTTAHQPRPRKLKSLPQFTDGRFRSVHIKVIAAPAFGGSEPTAALAQASYFAAAAWRSQPKPDLYMRRVTPDAASARIVNHSHQIRTFIQERELFPMRYAAPGAPKRR